MTPATNAIANGHGQAEGTAALASSGVAVPEILRPRLLVLIAAHSKARAELAQFYQPLMVVLGLPPGTDWDLDSDAMMLTPHRMQDGLPPASSE